VVKIAFLEKFIFWFEAAKIVSWFWNCVTILLAKIQCSLDTKSCHDSQNRDMIMWNQFLHISLFLTLFGHLELCRLVITSNKTCMDNNYVYGNVVISNEPW